MKRLCMLLFLIGILPVSAQDTPPIGWWDDCPTPQNLPQTVNLAAVLALSGGASVYGNSQQAGIQLAVDEMNDLGYFGDDVTLTITYGDSVSDPVQANAVMTEFVDDDTIVGVLGPTLSSEAFHADPIAQAQGLVVLGISNTAPGITDMGDYIFRNSLPESVVIPGVLDQVLDYYEIETVVLLYDGEDDFTLQGAWIFRDALLERDIDIIQEYVFATSNREFTGSISYLVSAEPDAVIVSTLAEQAILAINAIREAGFTGPIIGGNGFNSPAILIQTDISSDGVIAGAAWNLENPRNNDTSDWFVENYELAYMMPPDQFATQAYTGAWLLGTAIRCADSSNRADIRDALAAIQNFKSPLGDFSFDANREPVHTPVAQIVRVGEFVVLTSITAGE